VLRRREERGVRFKDGILKDVRVVGLMLEIRV
jgi:hypothetical protein